MIDWERAMQPGRGEAVDPKKLKEEEKARDVLRDRATRFFENLRQLVSAAS